MESPQSNTLSIYTMWLRMCEGGPESSSKCGKSITMVGIIFMGMGPQLCLWLQGIISWRSAVGGQWGLGMTGLLEPVPSCNTRGSL